MKIPNYATTKNQKSPNFQMRGKRKSQANHKGSDSELSILPTFLVCWGIILLDLCMHGLHQSLCRPGWFLWWNTFSTRSSLLDTRCPKKTRKLIDTRTRLSPTLFVCWDIFLLLISFCLCGILYLPFSPQFYAWYWVLSSLRGFILCFTTNHIF